MGMVWRRTALSPTVSQRCSQPSVPGFSLARVRRPGWSPFMPGGQVNWCSHAQEFAPIPRADGTCQLVLVIGEAACRRGQRGLPCWSVGTWPSVRLRFPSPPSARWSCRHSLDQRPSS
jgi:hypothetical protein